MKLLSGFAALAMLAASPAFAHHGWSGQEDKITALTGTVVQSVNLAGPHGAMKIKVGNQVWDITLAPPFRTSAAGLKQDTIPVGAMVTVHGNRNKDANRFEMKTVQVDYEAKHFKVY